MAYWFSWNLFRCNVAAGNMFGIPLLHSHAFVSSYVLSESSNGVFSETNRTELPAFTSYSLAFPNNYLALVDTYDAYDASELRINSEVADDAERNAVYPVASITRTIKILEEGGEEQVGKKDEEGEDDKVGVDQEDGLVKVELEQRPGYLWISRRMQKRLESVVSFIDRSMLFSDIHLAVCSFNSGIFPWPNMTPDKEVQIQLQGETEDLKWSEGNHDSETIVIIIKEG